jgi:hypothetical protein
VCIFYGRSVFLRPFGIFYCHLVYFSRFGILHQEKSGNPIADLKAFKVTDCLLIKTTSVPSASILMNHFQPRAVAAGLPDIFKPLIPIWVNFGEVSNGRCWYILWTFCIFYSHLIYFMDILWFLGTIFSRFGTLYQEKSGNPVLQKRLTAT